MGSKYASGPLNSPYEIAPLNKVVFFNIYVITSSSFVLEN